MATNLSDDNYDTIQAWGEENDIINNGSWTFTADAALTREQMMDMVYRFLVYKNVSMPAAANLSNYADNATLSNNTREAAAKLIASGIIIGDETGLRPTDTLTRAEATAVLMRIIKTADSSVS